MEKNKNWDDIPSLEGLTVDWEFGSKTSHEKRGFIRVNDEDVCGLFEMKEILIKIATARQTYTGRLLDISEGGLALSLSVLLDEQLEENLPVKVGFFLGTRKIISKAVVRHTQKIGDRYTTGIKFVDLGKETAEYIGGLYASQILRHQL